MPLRLLGQNGIKWNSSNTAERLITLCNDLLYFVTFTLSLRPVFSFTVIDHPGKCGDHRVLEGQKHCEFIILNNQHFHLVENLRAQHTKVLLRATECSEKPSLH